MRSLMEPCLVLSILLASGSGCGTRSSDAGTDSAPGVDSGPGTDAAGGSDAMSLDAASTDAGGTDATTGPDSGSDAGISGALPTGSVTVGASVGCPNGHAPGATCTELTVTCPGIQDITATVAVAEPMNPAVGTAFMIFGGGGTVFFDEGFPAEYLVNDLRVVQVLFATDWEEASAGSIKLAACRVATVVEWAFDNPHGASRTTGFCTHGHSGGSGGMGYSMAHYGLEAIVDYVVFDAGPVFGRIDYGCEPSLKGTGVDTRFVCADLPMGTFAYGSASALINNWTNRTTCGAPYGDASPGDIAAWADDSVVSPGGDYDWPQTETAFWYCANNSNEAAGLGSFLVDAMQSSFTVSCVTGTCQVEPPWLDPGGFTSMVNAMVAGCIPRH